MSIFRAANRAAEVLFALEMMMKTILAAIAALSFAASASAATDENPFAKDSTVLRLDGIDLSTADGQQRLAIRMDQAARTVCGDRLASVHLALDEQARDCRAHVVAQIRNQIEFRHVDSGLASNGSTGSTVRMASR